MEIHTVVKAARRCLKSTKYSFVITTDSAGDPSTRLAEHRLDNDLTVRFGTSPRSRKVRDVLANPRASVAAYDAKFAYTVLSGRARVVDDPAERAEWWLEEWRSFFPGGPDGDDFVILEITPDRIEAMDFLRQLTPPPFGLLPVVIVREGGEWVEQTAWRAE